MADNFDFLEPLPKTTVQVKLPSRGVPYPRGSAMDDGKLTLTPMTMTEEAIFANPQADGADAVDAILRRCITEQIDLNTLLSSDKFFLFMMLRAITYGPEYSFTWTCPSKLSIKETCGHKNDKTVRIPDDFQVKMLSDEDVEPFVVTLPESGKKIAFRLFRGYDEPAVEKWGEEIRAQQKAGVNVPDTSNAYRVVRHIISVDGKPVKEAPEKKILAFFLSLPAKDTQYLQDKINFFTPGINTDLTLVCSACGAVHDWDLPFTATFFRAVNPDEGGAVVDEVRPDVPPQDESPGSDDVGPSRTPVVLQEVEGDKGTGGRVRKAQVGGTSPRRVSRGGKTVASESGG